MDTTSTTGIRHDTSDTEGSLPSRVFNPGDINEAIVHASKWVDDHTTIGILTIVDHHESSADATLVWFIIYGKLIRLRYEATAKSLHVGRKRES